ncbi:2-amino-4-hydroxy-6-hydroxymethyldihydropteridine diphosphokinase [Erythrobacter sp. F6033]|uniref:2-amino-4-hydroxy-6- hydroxymethyldihydropteridine diphosphokinase n=1 Tax=Erythrobacter sp. F6033 TaxID=2926401 RepID=UPI001FF12FF9|nr:2-amino-4-hydroxy-6-hydroxymethyldihydropteridine diphosphokinase [Erythrobacter sp. F6033]MCK0129367.1 2-amino-4-hydroxy-6-hydroxymethyldihydropteridine diphosphokinase [Erythrobacter sp. F6033]
MSSSYLIALGSNRRHPIYGRPRDVLRAVMEELAALGTVSARAPIIDSAPMGPAQRQFANGAAVLDSEYDPPALLAGLKRMERAFGRRKGRRWGDRVLDLDIVLWSGGEWQSDELTIPHVDFRERDFVLSPAGAIAGDWRDPVSGLSVRQLAARI